MCWEACRGCLSAPSYDFSVAALRYGNKALGWLATLNVWNLLPEAALLP